MKPFRSLVAGAATAFVALGMAGPAWTQKVTLDVLYAQPGFAKYHEPIAQAFMKTHPDVEIKFRAPPRITTRVTRRCCAPRSPTSCRTSTSRASTSWRELAGTLEKRGPDR